MHVQGLPLVQIMYTTQSTLQTMYTTQSTLQTMYTTQSTLQTVAPAHPRFAAKRPLQLLEVVQEHVAAMPRSSHGCRPPLNPEP